MVQMVKNSSVMQETQVPSLGQEDSSEKGMATHSSIVAWRIPWTKEPGGLQPMGLQRVGHNQRLTHMANKGVPDLRNVRDQEIEG